MEDSAFQIGGSLLREIAAEMTQPFLGETRTLHGKDQELLGKKDEWISRIYKLRDTLPQTLLIRIANIPDSLVTRLENLIQGEDVRYPRSDTGGKTPTSDSPGGKYD